MPLPAISSTTASAVLPCSSRFLRSRRDGLPSMVVPPGRWTKRARRLYRRLAGPAPARACSATLLAAAAAEGQPGQPGDPATEHEARDGRDAEELRLVAAQLRTPVG